METRVEGHKRHHLFKAVFYLFKTFEFAFRSIYFVLAILVISGLMYILGGHAYLNGQWGTDTTSALSMYLWINKYFPHVPFWYPLAGGGVSFINAYPVLSFFIAVFLSRVISLGPIQAFTLLGFSSVLLMAISIYAFVTFRFKNQTAGLIASVFYLLSPMAWVWLTQWGFYAENIAHGLVGWALLFWDLFFTSYIESGLKGLTQRFFFFFAVIFLSFSLLVHFTTGFTLMYLFFFYIVGYTLKSKQKKLVIKRGFIALVSIGLLSFLLTFFVTFSFQRYAGIAAQAGLTGGSSFEQVKLSELPILKVLGFEHYKKDEFLFAVRSVSFPSFVSLLAVIGIILSFQDPRLLAFALFAIFSLITTNAEFMYWSARLIPSIISSGFGWRATFVLLRIVWPTLAAMGIIRLLSLPFFWIKKAFLLIPIQLIVSVLAVSIAVFFIYQGNISLQPRHLTTPPRYIYGANTLDLRNIWLPPNASGDSSGKDFCVYPEDPYLYQYDNVMSKNPEASQWCSSAVAEYFPPMSIANWCSDEAKREPLLARSTPLCSPAQLTHEKALSFWNSCKDGTSNSPACTFRYLSVQEQIDFKNWPKFALHESFDPFPALKDELMRIAAVNPQARIDFSPYASTLSMAAPIYNLEGSLSQIHYYITNASLILRNQGWQSIVYYMNASQYRDANLVNNLARWFGINYVFLTPQTDATLFTNAGWKQFSRDVFQFPESNPLAALSSKLSVLAIGQKKYGSYDQVLTLSSLGVLPYNEAYLVWGNDAIDDYSISELERFNILILQGYTYHSKGRANELLNQYVANGGNIYIDTGWQYKIPDWESDNPFDIIPLTRLQWTDLGKTSAYSFADQRFADKVDLSQFAPLVYGDGSWSVSTSDTSNLKDWGKVVLSAEGKPLVIYGQVGKGRIVWSGMNLFAHARQENKVNHDEIDFLRNIFVWFEDGQKPTDYSVSYDRINPDRVEFTINDTISNGGFLLWKEGYHPDFHATLATGNTNVPLTVYRGGPGWDLFYIPQAVKGDIITYAYQKPLVEYIVDGVSLLTLVFLVLILLDGFLGKYSLLIKLFHLFSKSSKKIDTSFMKKMGVSFLKESEDDY